MRVIIAGSRGAKPSEVRDAISRCPWSNFISAVVSGTARGADQEGERWAEDHGIEVIQVKPEWEKYGKRAGPIRNRKMAEIADGLIAVWDGASRGTFDMIKQARDRGLRVFATRPNSQDVLDWNAQGALAERWMLAEERAAILEFGSGKPRTRAEAEREAGLQVRGDLPPVEEGR